MQLIGSLIISLYERVKYKHGQVKYPFEHNIFMEVEMKRGKMMASHQNIISSIYIFFNLKLGCLHPVAFIRSGSGVSV
jgi:hypothetical protein